MVARKIKIHQHHIETFLTCREKFNLSENLCITRRFQKKELNLGSAFHAGARELKKGNKDFLIEGYKYFNDLTPESQEEQRQVEWGKAVVTAMLVGYAQRYEKDFILIPYNPIRDIEQKISISISANIKLIGTPDSIEIREGRYWIGEEKTTGRLDQDYVEKLPLDFQMTFYFLLAQKFYRKKFDGVIYRITRVCALRQKKGQSWDAFLNEISNDYIARPEWYFICEKLYRSSEDITRFKSEIEMQVKDLMECYKTRHWYRHTRQCTQYGCEFMKYCKDPTEETLNTFYVYREDLDKCFSIMNKIRVDRPTLSGKGTHVQGSQVSADGEQLIGGTTKPEKVSPDLPF